MKLSTLLVKRQSLLQQARLANLAFAHETLAKFAARIDRARLRGTVTLKSAAPELERFWATLTALDGHQSVLEEHFTDEDLMELADVMAFVADGTTVDETFALEDLAEKYLAPVRAELLGAGVALDERAQQTA